MGKSSSSSRKKKRSDASPLALKSRKSKSKRRRDKSRKLRRRHDSDSYLSDYDSPVCSYSSSEDDHKRTRRLRSPVRGSKRRNRRRSYSSESSEDSYPVRKRKRSRRNDDVGARNKGHKKKPKRRASVSSISNGSLSFSTSDGRSRSSDESEFERRRGRSRRRDEHDPLAGKDKAAGDRSRYRSRSCSPYNRCSISGDDLSEKRVAIASSSMRLRSVIMVCDNTQESKLDRDEQKEEILYDKDDYPSRSNDSNDGGGKRELATQFSVDSTMKRQAGNEEIEKAADLDMRSAGIVENSEAGSDLIHASNPSSDVAPLNTVKQDNIANAVDEDLELVLRQRALENLKRFQRSDKVGEVSDHCEKSNDVKQTPVDMKVSKEDSAISDLTTRHKETVASIHKRLSTNTTSIDGKTGGKELVSAGSSITRGSVQVTGAGFPANKPRTFTWRRDSTKTDLVPKEQLRSSNVQPQHKLLAAQIAANSAKLLPPVDISSSDSGVNKQSGSAALDPTSSSCTKYVSGETSSADKVQDESKDKPQYEQKTMSVTRGGETIQVNYQVYIPKRVPALARRHLKR